MVTAYIGMGANLGNTTSTLNNAIAAIEKLPHTQLLLKSSFYATAPIDADGPDYTNAVIKINTSLKPLELLDALQLIENQHGRKRSYLNAPRTLDLDILIYNQQTIHTKRLALPHPRMHERAFVLKPLFEIEPNLQLKQGSVVGLLSEMNDQEVRLA